MRSNGCTFECSNAYFHYGEAGNVSYSKIAYFIRYNVGDGDNPLYIAIALGVIWYILGSPNPVLIDCHSRSRTTS